MDPLTFIAGAVAGKATESVIDSAAELWEEAQQNANDDVPEEYRIEPRPEFAGPLFEAAKYHGDPGVLRAMFRELLETGMDERREHLAHPGFVKVLEEISADEGLILHEMKTGTELRGRCLIWQRWEREEVDTPWSREINFEGDTSQLTYPNNIEMYTDHLIKMGVLKTEETYVEADRTTVNSLLGNQKVTEAPNRRECDVILSDFGDAFVSSTTSLIR